MLSYDYRADDAIGSLDSLARELDNPEPLLRGFASYRKSQFYQGLASGTDPYGASYSPLSSAYAVAKSARYGGRPVLTASGAMRGSYQSKVSGTNLIESVDSPAGYHQTGTSKMAKRPVLPDDRGLPPKDQEKLLELAETYISRAIGGGR